MAQASNNECQRRRPPTNAATEDSPLEWRYIHPQGAGRGAAIWKGSPMTKYTIESDYY